MRKIKAIVLDHTVEPVDPPAPQSDISLDNTAYSGNEGTVISFNVLRSQDTTERVSADWSIINTTAVTPSSGTVTFEVGITSQQVDITTSLVDGNEIGSVVLSNAINLDGGLTPAIVSPSTASFTILDLDPVSFTDWPHWVYWCIGGGTRTSFWSQTDEGTQTAWACMADITCVNFSPQFPVRESEQGPSAALMRSWNPNLILGEYKDPSALSANANSYDRVTHGATIESYFISGTNGAADGDGWTRESDGSIADGHGFFYKWGVNPTRAPGLINDRYVMEYTMEERYKESFRPSTGANYDFVFWDLWRWVVLYSELNDADYDMDNSAEVVGTGDGTIEWVGIDEGIVKKRGHDRVNALHNASYGKDLVQGGNCTTNYDLWWAARSDTGPIFLTAAKQPTDWQSITNYTYFEWWAKDGGFDADGSAHPPGNATRAIKTASRMRDFTLPNALTGDKVVILQFLINDPTLDSSLPLLVTTTQRWAIFRYGFALATVLGCYLAPESLTTHRTMEIIDEMVADDIYPMTVAQVLSAKGWLGSPVGAFAYWDIDATGEDPSAFNQGVQGGVIGTTGVYGMEFDNGFVLANPKGNGTKTVTLPISGLTRFLGAQDSGVNNGAAVGATVQMLDSTGLFLKKI